MTEHVSSTRRRSQPDLGGVHTTRGLPYRPFTSPSRKRTFQNCSLHRRNFKTSVFRFSCGRKTFRNGVFRKRYSHDNHVISLPELFSITNPKWSVIIKFLRSSVDVKHFIHFSELKLCCQILPA